MWSVFLLSLFSLSCQEDNPVQSNPAQQLLSVLIEQPGKNSAVNDSITVKIQVTGIKDSGRVELYIDSKLTTYFTKPPYTYIWYTNNYSEGSQHVLMAKAYDLDGNVAKSKAVLVYVYRFQPNNLYAMLTTDTTAVLQWHDNCSFETGFEIEERINNEPFHLIKTDSANTTIDTLKGEFSIGNYYYFRVRAKADTSYSLYSNTAYANIYLAPPTGLTIKFETDTAVILNWIDNSSFEDGFYIYKSYYTPSNIIDTLPKNTTTARISGQYLTTTVYQFAVLAYSFNGPSGSSSFVYGSPILEAPTDLAYTQISKKEIYLSWKDNSNFEKGFVIERNIDNGPFIELATVSSNVTNYNDNTLDTTKTYKYRVKAYTNFNSSDYSNEIKIVYSEKISPANTLSNTNFSDIDDSQAYYYYSNSGFIINIHRLNDGVTLKTFTASPDTAQLGNTFMGLGYKAVTFNSDWTKMVSAGITIDYFDVSNNYKIAAWQGASGFAPVSFHLNRINDAVFTKDNSTLITCLNDSTLKYWDLNSRTLIKDINLNFAIESFRLSSDGSKIIAKTWGGKIKILDAASGSFLYDFQNSDNVISYNISQDGNYVYAYTQTNYFIIWQLNSGNVYKIWQNQGNVAGISLNSDNKVLINSYNNYSVTKVQFWDVSNGDLISNAVIDNSYGGLGALKFSKDDKYIYSNTGNKLIKWIIGYHWFSL